MNPSPTRARVVGGLFLLATASYVAGSQLIESAMAPLPSSRKQVVCGALLVLVDAVAVIAIGIAMSSLLKRWHRSASAGYLALRVVEAVLLLVGVLGPLALLSLGAKHLESDRLELVAFLAMKTSYWAYQLAMIVVGIAGLVFSALLLRSRLVPRVLAILGLVGYPLLAVGAALDMMGVVDSLHGAPLVVFVGPGGLFELVLPLWLIVRGFDFPGASRFEVRRLLEHLDGENDGTRRPERALDV
jgi:hypothetical protein